MIGTAYVTFSQCHLPFVVTNVSLKKSSFVVECEALASQCPVLEVKRRGVIVTAPDGSTVFKGAVDGIGWDVTDRELLPNQMLHLELPFVIEAAK